MKVPFIFITMRWHASCQNTCRRLPVSLFTPKRRMNTFCSWTPLMTIPLGGLRAQIRSGSFGHEWSTLWAGEDSNNSGFLTDYRKSVSSLFWALPDHLMSSSVMPLLSYCKGVFDLGLDSIWSLVKHQRNRYRLKGSCAKAAPEYIIIKKE